MKTISFLFILLAFSLAITPIISADLPKVAFTSGADYYWTSDDGTIYFYEWVQVSRDVKTSKLVAVYNENLMCHN